jgi:predicted HTH transcriptional regulator
MLREDAWPIAMKVGADAASTHLQGMNMNFKDFFSNNPLDLFPRVRKEDPITSFEAADSIKEVSAKHHKIILECLEKNGPLGKDGIAKLTGLESNQIARRMNEMKVIGLVSLTGKTVKSNSGRNEREWTV